MPVVIPPPAKHPSADAPEVHAKRRRVDSVESEDSIQEIKALKKTVSKIGATRPEVVVPSRKRGAVNVVKAASSSTGKKTLAIPALI